MSTKIKVKKEHNIPLIKVTGVLSADEVSEFSKKIKTLMEGNVSKIAVDLHDTDFIDSHCLGVLIFIWNQMKKDGKELILFNPQGFVREILNTANLDRIMRIVDSLEEV